VTTVPLASEPDWVGAAQALIDGLNGQTDPDARVGVLERVCEALGSSLYPGFIKLLAAIGRFGDEAARRLAADTLARAIVTARLPSTRLPAWGASRFAQLPGGDGLMINTRSLGPLEFLCVWRTRDVVGEPLDDEGFRTAAVLTLTLVGASAEASRLYADKLGADIAATTEGLHDSRSRALLRIMATGLAECRDPQATSEALLEASLADRAQDRWSFVPR
jgi:hypothetical protein